MALPLYLAMTAAEFTRARRLPTHPAWMACHFSPYGAGLCNLPERLPKGAMVLVNDRTPIHGHDPRVIAGQVRQLTLSLSPGCVLLDFQRPGEAETAAVVKAILESSACPVGVSAPYARGLSCPVFLPPPPLHCPLELHLAPWDGRELWLEVFYDTEELVVTPQGTAAAPALAEFPERPAFRDAALRCHYQILRQPSALRFRLWRTGEDLAALLVQGEAMGAVMAVGLYQEFQRAAPGLAQDRCQP